MMKQVMVLYGDKKLQAIIPPKLSSQGYTCTYICIKV